MPLPTKKVVRDVLYGFVELDEQEVEIMNHPAFQRLRRIKQLAFTDMVYPGACHTRFEHSLGVMYMATRMYDHVVDNYESVLREVGEGIGIDSQADFDIEKKKARKIIRLAALLHDVGHAPFSHSGEDIMPFRNQDKDLRYKHEDYSAKIIEECFKDIIENYSEAKRLGISVHNITSLIDDKSSVKGAGGLHFGLKPIISSQLDADRADYLLRDSIHIGVDYGKYDMWRLINCMALAKDEDDEIVFAIAEKGLEVVESFIIARYHMFRQIYYHKVREIYDYHAGKALAEVLPELGHPNSVLPPPSNIKEYLELDDWRILGAISNNDGRHCEIIKKRSHFKCRPEGRVSNPGADDIRKFLEYENEYKDKEHFIHSIGVYSKDKEASPWYKEGRIKILNEDGTLVKLEDKSKLIESLMKDKRKMMALYLPRSEEECYGQV